MGFLEIERAVHLLLAPLGPSATMTRADGSQAVTGCPDKNFLNPILFEIIDSNGQTYIQYSVHFAITIVFINIMFHIPGTQREKLDNTVTITPNSPLCLSPDKQNLTCAS